MFHPTRGGQGDFKWSDVAADKDREYYLGHSLNAPVGRWQQGKDLTWYNKDRGDAEEAERQRREELKRIKEAEEDALSQALGFAPTPRAPTDTGSSSLGAAVNTEDAAVDKAKLKAERRAEKEARRAERDERRKERSRATIPPRFTNATWVATVLHYALRMAETGTAETGVTGRRSG
ncbi:MMtag domain-containing protein [Rhodotorula paludigena]|uniref:MMtag domain-containing protein n=1 Tax=Rhodotorula paludigena TaxID=86838 RepID=UPI00316D9263